jgi:hypothetical protein
MQTYILTTPNGFKYRVNAENEPSPEDREEFLRSIKVTAQDQLRGGYSPPPKPRKLSEPNSATYGSMVIPGVPVAGIGASMVMTGDKERAERKEFYIKNITDLLAIPRSDFDYENAAPTGLRTKLSPLRVPSAKAWWLANEYGRENVRPVMIKGRDSILYRDPNSKNNKWRFYDHMDTELADFAELANELPPIIAGTAVGLKTMAATSAVATPVVGVPTGALAGAAMEQAVGSGQDALARKALGIPDDIDADFLQRRFDEAKINFGLGVVLPVVGKIPFKRIIGVASDQPAVVATKKAMQAGDGTPIRYQLEGTQSLNRLTDIASRFPGSAGDMLLADVRTNLNQRVLNSFGVKELSPEAFEKTLLESTERIAKKFDLDEKTFKDSILTLVADQRTLKNAAGEIVESEVRAKATADALKMFQTQLNQKAKNVIGKDVSTEATGLSFKQDMVNHFVATEAKVSNMYDEAFTLLRGVEVPVDSVSAILNRSKRKAILNADDEVISVLAPSGRTASGRAVNSLDDILEEGITFKQFNDLVKKVREKAGFGSKDVTTDQSVYRQLSKDLELERTRILNLPTTPAAGKEAFDNANTAFREEIKPLRENIINKNIEAPSGANYGEAIALAKRGEDFSGALPNANTYIVGGTELASDALRSPAKIRAFMKATGDSFQSRQKLRTMWLNGKGLVAGRDIPVSALTLSKKERDIVAELWGKNVDGFNQRLKVLDRLKAFADTKDGYIEGLSAKTVNEILDESSTRTTQELFELGEKELLERASLKELQNEEFFKMMGNKEIPIPSSSATFDTFSERLYTKANADDFEAVVNQYRALGGDAEESLILSVLQTMVTKASRNKEIIQYDSLNNAMWSPIELRKILEKNKQNLRYLFGNKRYDDLVDLNEAVDRVSVFPKYTGGVDELEVRVNVSMGGKASGFIPNIWGASKDRLAKFLIYNQINNPINFKRLVSPEDYERLNMQTMQGMFTTAQFLPLAREAEDDPDFRLMMEEILGSLGDPDEGELAPTEQPVEQPVQ